MRCPTCGYDVDPARGLTCLRCGTTLDCSAVDCEACGVCTSPLTRIGRRLRSTRSGGRPGRGEVAEEG